MCFKTPCIAYLLNHLLLCLTEGCKDGQKHGQTEAGLATDKELVRLPMQQLTNHQNLPIVELHLAPCLHFNSLILFSEGL